MITTLVLQRRNISDVATCATVVCTTRAWHFVGKQTRPKPFEINVSYK